MPRTAQKEKIEKYLQDAKEIEQHKILPGEKVKKLGKESESLAKKLTKYLSKTWFVESEPANKSRKKRR